MNHKYETSRTRRAPVHDLPIIGSSSLYGIERQVVVGTCISIVFHRVNRTRSGSCWADTRSSGGRLGARVWEPQQRLPRMERYMRKLRARSIGWKL